jgi:hypothetical protein
LVHGQKSETGSVLGHVDTIRRGYKVRQTFFLKIWNTIKLNILYMRHSMGLFFCLVKLTYS